MKKITILTKLFAIIFLIVGQISAANVVYYVKTTGSDTNNGSEESPFRTVNYAFSKAQANAKTTFYLENNAVFEVPLQIDLGSGKNIEIIGKNTTLQKAVNPGVAQERILKAGANSITRFKGVNFVHGRLTTFYPGGAIFFAGDSLIIDSCKFFRNEAGAAGGAIGSRGKVLILKNSYFEGNYTASNGSNGAAVMHAGLASGMPGSALIVENCTFKKNKMNQGGNGSAIGIFDASFGTPGRYSNLDYMRIVNCTFSENTTPTSFQAAVDITNYDVESYFINNTFIMNDGGIRVGNNTRQIYFMNNVLMERRVGVMTETKTVDGRTPIIAYNNIICGLESAFNQGIDDLSLNADKGVYSNVTEIIANYPFSNIGLSDTLITKDCLVGYYPIISETSTLHNAGIDNSSSFTNGINMIPQSDVNGKAKNGLKDIGASEFYPLSGIRNLDEDISDFCSLLQTQSNIMLFNNTENEMSLKIISMNGSIINTTKFIHQLSINKNSLKGGLYLFVFNNEHKSKSFKIFIN